VRWMSSSGYRKFSPDILLFHCDNYRSYYSIVYFSILKRTWRTFHSVYWE
jgi:hypothetical protein